MRTAIDTNHHHAKEQAGMPNQVALTRQRDGREHGGCSSDAIRCVCDAVTGQTLSTMCDHGVVTSRGFGMRTTGRHYANDVTTARVKAKEIPPPIL